jgi:hypothetical protein
VADEAERRGYRFDRERILESRFRGKLVETRGQLLYEWRHLQTKLRLRAVDHCRGHDGITCPEAHPLFRIVPGEVREWEKSKATPRETSRRR